MVAKMYRKISNKSGLTLSIKGDSKKSLVIENCTDLVLEDILVSDWKSSGDIVKGGDYAIILKNCQNVTLIKPVIEGEPDESSKESWRYSVGNGIRVNDDCTGIVINGHNLSRLHFPVDNRGESTIENGTISFISGDHIISRSSNTVIRGNRLLNSLQVLEYSLIHRDYIQKFAVNNGLLENVLIEGNTCETDLNSHKWAKDPDEALIFSDGTGKNISVLDNSITTESHIAILLNPCVNSEIKDNKIFSSGNPTVSCEDRKNTGGTIDVEIANNTYPNYNFASWCDSLRNLNAPSITENDYKLAGEKLSISAAMVAAVSAVESRGYGFNSDGSVRGLLERHKVYKYAKEEGCLSEMMDAVGANNCSRELGGYLGGIAEYDRLKKVGSINKIVALKAFSVGTHQIMLFNHKLAGYDNPEDMFVKFHESEQRHLDGFVEFIINNRLYKYLQEAEDLVSRNKSPLKPLNEFANRYNGRSHKRYDLKIANAYNAELKKRNGYNTRSIPESTTNQGGITATIGTVGAGLTVTEMLGYIKQTRELAETVESGLGREIDALKEKVAEPNYLLWVIIGCLVLAQFGVFTSLWARIQDRLKGLHL